MTTNDTENFNNLIAPLLASLGNTAMLIELAALIGIGILSWFAVHRLKRRLGDTDTLPIPLADSDWSRLVLPLGLLAPVLIGRAVLAHWQSVHLFNLAVPLLLSFLAIQGCFYVLRAILKPSRVLQTVERMVSWLVWGVFALHLTGYLGDVAATLHGIGFHVGKQYLSLYTVLVGLLSLAATLVLALWLARTVEQRVIGAMPVTGNIRLALSKLARTVFVVLAVLVALPMVGIDITVLSVFGGALGVGLGLGLQKVAANYVSGFTLLLDQSIRIGDMIQVNEHYGEVKEIATRYTVIRNRTGIESVIPNEIMVTSPVINRSLSDRNNQVRLPVQVAYRTDLDRVRELLTPVVADHPRVLPEPAPQVRLARFGENGIDLELVFWIADPELGEGRLRSELNWAVWDTFKREGIEIPYPQRVVHLVDAKSQPD